MSSAFTGQPKGTVKELWQVTWPLVLSLASGSIMYFVDRIFLAQLSINSMTAAVNAAMVAWLFIAFSMAITQIAEVFVGQNNGAGDHKNIGQPVWQMVWFSVIASIAFIFLAFWMPPWTYTQPGYEREGIEYFRTIMVFGGMYPFATALSAFFIARGDVKIVTWTTVCSNLVNIILNPLLIFGFADLVPSLGTMGSALATGIAQSIQVIILFKLFLRKDHQESYGTNDYSFNFKIFKEGLRLGLPSAMAFANEIFAWTIYMRLMTALSKEHLVVATIASSCFILFAFVCEALSKAVVAIASNMIGAGNPEKIWGVILSGIKLMMLFLGGLAIPFVFFPDALIHLFFNNSELDPHLYSVLMSTLFLIWVAFFFDGVNWVMVGVLTATGATKVVMWTSAVSIWLFAIVPIYIATYHFGATADFNWMMITLYLAISIGVYVYIFAKSQREQQQPILLENSFFNS